MKSSTNEWISISDLMAGIVSVIVMLLAVSILQQLITSLMNKMNEQQDVVVHQKLVDEIFGEIRNDFQGASVSKLVRFDNEKDKIIFTDGIFLSGSAKVTTEVQQALNSAKPKIIKYLSELDNCLIYIEGHSDNTPVIHPVINKEKYGAVYDDNYTLSAARAREARNVLLGDISDQYANRIIVAGYGYSKPLKGLDPGNAANRRIEIRFVLENPANGK